MFWSLCLAFVSVFTSGMHSQMILRSEALRLRVSEHPKDIFFARVGGLITLAPENWRCFTLFGYMVFHLLYWMIMLLSHDIRNHIGHQECFLVGTYCAWTSIIEELEIFRWQVGKIHNRKSKTWVSESGDCASEQWTQIWSNFAFGVFEVPFLFTAFVMPV